MIDHKDEETIADRYAVAFVDMWAHFSGKGEFKLLILIILIFQDMIFVLGENVNKPFVAVDADYFFVAVIFGLLNTVPEEVFVLYRHQNHPIEVGHSYDVIAFWSSQPLSKPNEIPVTQAADLNGNTFFFL